MTETLTDQQRAAIETRKVSIALSAGAGCGKTFVLTRRFLTYLAPPGGAENLHRIVAITFTDRAAREMRDRIREACRQQLKSCSPEEVPHWLEIIRGIDSARISTIHSFCAALLRAHAVDAGVDPAFGLMEELTGDSFRRNSVADALNDCLASRDDDAMLLVREYGLERARDLLRSLVVQRYRIDFSRFAGTTAEQHAADWLERWQTEFVPLLLKELVESEGTRRTLAQLQENMPSHQEMQRRREVLLKHLLSGEWGVGSGEQKSPESRGQSREQEAGRVAGVGAESSERSPQQNRVSRDAEFSDQSESPGVASFSFSPLPTRHSPLTTPSSPLPTPHSPLAGVTDGDLLARLGEIRECAQVQGGGGKKAWSDEETYEAVKNGFEQLRKEIDKLVVQLAVDPAHVAIATTHGLAALRLAERIGGEYDAAKHEAALLDFDDLLLQTRDLLRDSAEVRQRAAASIRFLMVDEFQDTDPIQAEIVRMLAGEELLTGKLFLVGDAKQSIYRFRRADPRVFHGLRNELPDGGRLPLSVNFRSQPAVLNFVNCVFGSSMADYEPLSPHDERQMSPVPAIEFLFPTLPEEAERDTADVRRRCDADWIARRINSLLHDATPRIRIRNQETGEYELRPPQPGDFAILFRSLNNVGLYEEALRRYGIEYYLVGGRSFYAQQEVFDVANLCQFLDDPDDEIALAGALRSPFFSLPDDALFAMVREEGSLWGALRTSAGSGDLSSTPHSPLPTLHSHRQVQYAAAVLHELRVRKNRLPLAELLNLAIERTGYDAAVLTEFLGQRKLANLRKLVELARQFDQAGFVTLKDFVIRVRESVLEESDEELAATHPETSNVVRLMTIHQSKGLEFPVVVVADMDWRGTGRRGDAVLHPEFGALLQLPRVHGEVRENLGQRMHRLQEKPEDERETQRLLYVAMTRAADHLVLSACLPKTGRISSPWLKLLSQRFDLATGLPAIDPYLGRLSLGDVPSSAIPEIRVHHQPPEIGIPDAPLKPREVSLSDFIAVVDAAEPVELPDLLRRIEPETNSRRQFSVSALEAADAELRRGISTGRGPEAFAGTVDRSAPEDRLDAEKLGTLVHAVLERIDFAAPQPSDEILNLLEGGSRAPLDGRLRSKAAELVAGFLECDAARSLASAARCYRELEFELRWPVAGNERDVATITGKIDCLFQSANGTWHILDYKTAGASRTASDFGAAGPRTASMIPPDAGVEAYEIQLGLYRQAVAQFLGHPPESVQLVFLGDDVRTVPFHPTVERSAQLTQRIDAAIERIRAVGIALPPDAPGGL